MKRLCFDKNPKAICTIYSSFMMKSLEMTSKFCCIFIFKEQKWPKMSEILSLEYFWSMATLDRYLFCKKTLFLQHFDWF